MTLFRVKVDYEHGKWIKNHSRPVVDVLASDAKEAAEFACGTKLLNRGRPNQYRAQVWPSGGVRNAREIAHFFSN